jgi:nitrilase
MAIMLGCIERPTDRGGHSVYATLVYIDSNGIIQSVHRKLMPTYEERLTWAQGDGNGLRTHELGSFTVGGLNCWENWMPLARAALYGQGEDLHVAVWPGSLRNTQDITRFIAMEARSFVLSVSSLLRVADIPADTPYRSEIVSVASEVIADGGSCIAGPDGKWIVEPVVGEEKLILATLNHQHVREERQNFDPAGHYSRPDVLRLTVNRQRQSTLKLIG